MSVFNQKDQVEKKIWPLCLCFFFFRTFPHSDLPLSILPNGWHFARHLNKFRHSPSACAFPLYDYLVCQVTAKARRGKAVCGWSYAKDLGNWSEWVCTWHSHTSFSDVLFSHQVNRFFIWTAEAASPLCVQKLWSTYLFYGRTRAW